MNGILPKAIILLALGAALASCTTSPEQRTARFNAQCAAGGLKPDTDAFNDCVTKLETDREVRIHTRHRELMERPDLPTQR